MSSPSTSGSLAAAVNAKTEHLTSFGLTHVYYDASDPTKLSLISAWLAIVPQALCVAYASVFFTTREVEVLLMALGQTISEIINFLVKRAIREERPPTMVGKGYGMPSSHAQFAFFFSTYSALFLLLRHKPTHTTVSPSTVRERQMIAAFGLFCACAVASSRVYLNYHTPKQVVIGCTLGLVFAITWFFVVDKLRSSGLVEWVLETDLAGYCRIRDWLVSEDFADGGWARWQAMKAERELRKVK